MKDKIWIEVLKSKIPELEIELEKSRVKYIQLQSLIQILKEHEQLKTIKNEQQNNNVR